MRVGAQLARHNIALFVYYANKNGNTHILSFIVIHVER